MTGKITRLFFDESGGIVTAGTVDYAFDRRGLDDETHDYLDIGDEVEFVEDGASLDGPRARQIHFAPEVGA